MGVLLWGQGFWLACCLLWQALAGHWPPDYMAALFVACGGVWSLSWGAGVATPARRYR